MDIGRLCGVQRSEDHATRQGIAEYVKLHCSPYRGMRFTAREEWVAEQTIQGLRLLLADVHCTDEERQTVEEFLSLASEELLGNV